MPNSAISEESFFFLRVESLCRGGAITCGPDMAVTEAARLMKRHNISGLIVVDGAGPVGVASVRDLRDLIADGGEAIQGTRVLDIMTVGLVTVHPGDYVFEAMFKMAKHNIHRLAVVGAGGELVGIVTDTDLLRIQSRTPLYLNQEIEAAESIPQLKDVSGRMLDMVNYAYRAGADIRSLVQLISHFNDAFTQRIIFLLGSQEGIRLPGGAAYLALGSEGRGEQTLRTDQDSAIVYRDDLPPERLSEIERFASRLSAALDEIGVPRCPGDTMASNPQWCRSLSDWKRVLDQWISVPKSEHMVNFGMFQDLRVIYGEEDLERQLHDHIRAAVQRHSLFLPYMARHICHFPPPLGMFGRIRVERRGEHRGKVDLKKAGIFALTLGASLMALEAGSLGGSTWSKLEFLRGQGVLGEGEFEVLDESFTFLVRLRLERQLRALASGTKPTNHVDPLVMRDRERDQFRQALKGVGTLLKTIRDRYKLDFISR